MYFSGEFFGGRKKPFRQKISNLSSDSPCSWSPVVGWGFADDNSWCALAASNTNHSRSRLDYKPLLWNSSIKRIPKSEQSVALNKRSYCTGSKDSKKNPQKHPSVSPLCSHHVCCFCGYKNGTISYSHSLHKTARGQPCIWTDSFQYSNG